MKLAPSLTVGIEHTVTDAIERDVQLPEEEIKRNKKYSRSGLLRLGPEKAGFWVTMTN